jgi:two-component sensor histidine kinase
VGVHFDLPVALCDTVSEDDAVRSTLRYIAATCPGCGAAVRFPIGDSYRSLGDGALGRSALDALSAGSPGARDAGVRLFELSDAGVSCGILACVLPEGRAGDEAEDENIRRAARLLASALGRIAAARRYVAAIEDRELLVREYRHRMRNSLQLIKGTIAFLIRAVSSVGPEVIDSIDERLGALMSVHEMLSWTESTGRVSAEDYFLRLAEALRLLTPQGAGTLIAYYDAGREVFLPVDRAATIGLIVHELLMNSVKHAAGKLLRMSVRVDYFNGDLYIRYSETPVDPLSGIPLSVSEEAFPVPISEGAGLGIIRSLLTRARGRRLDDESIAGTFSACFSVD